MTGRWTPPPAPAETEWKLAPRWLELEQDGFLELEDCTPLILEEDE